MQRSGLLLALTSAAAFGTSGAFARGLIQAGWTPAAAVTARIGIAALVLALPGLWAMRGRWPVLRRNAGMILAYGLIAVAGCQVFYFNAVAQLSVGVALLLEYMGTVLVVGWLWLRHGERPQALTVAGTALSIAGLLLVLVPGAATALPAAGVAWALAAAVGLAMYFVLSARSDAALPPVTLAAAGMGVGTIVLLGLGALGLLPMRAAFTRVAFSGGAVDWWIPVLGLALVAAVLAYLTGIAAARRLGPKLAAFVSLSEVVFAVLVAWLLLDELPGALQLAGGALIVGGIALVRLDELRTPTPTPVAEPVHAATLARSPCA